MRVANIPGRALRADNHARVARSRATHRRCRRPCAWRPVQRNQTRPFRRHGLLRLSGNHLSDSGSNTRPPMSTLQESLKDPPTQRSTHALAGRAAVRNFGWIMLDKALALVFGLAVFGLIARWFGSAASGHFAYALALLQSALGLSLVCSAAALLPRLYRMRTGIAATLANVFVVRLIGSTLAAIGAALFALLVIDDPVRLEITLLILLSVPLIEPFYTAVVYWQSRNDNRCPTLSRAAGLFTRAAVVILAIFLGAPLWVVALAWVCEACVSALLLYSSVRPLATLRMFVQRVSSG